MKVKFGMATKICFISGVIARAGGTERVGCIIANALASRGYDVEILSFWNHGEPFYSVDKNVKVNYLLEPKTEGKLYRTYIYPIIKLHRYIKKNQIDIVIDIDTKLSQYTSYAICGTNCRQIAWEHFNYWTMEKQGDRRWFQAKKLIKKYASKLVVLTEQDRLKHIKEYNLDPEFVIAMPNPSLANVKSDYDYTNKTFLAVGRLAWEKRFDLLLDAWKIAQEKCLGWKLIIVGTGELEDELKAQTDKNKLSNVIFAGHSNEMDKYYREASCLVLSSEYEGFPMVILEAFSFGLPAIAFNCKTGPSDLIIEGENGYLVEAGNVDELAAKMVTFSLNKSMADQMSNSALQSIKEYSLDSITSRWCDVIDEIIEKSRR